MQIAMQVWKEKEDGTLSIDMELPIHHIMDFMLLLSRTMLYFREAYRHPLLYNPDNPVIERIGVQGGVMPVNICIGNPNIDNDIKKFSQAFSDLGELTGERMRVLSRIFEEMEYYKMEKKYFLSPARRLTEEEQKLVWKKPATHIESHAEHRICEEVKRNWERGEMRITNILLEGMQALGKPN